MKKEELEKKLENLARPEIRDDEYRNRLKLTLLNAKKTAWWGTLLIILPALFLTGVFLKYGLGIGFLFDPLDKYIFGPVMHSRYKIIEPLVLFILPLLVLVANILAITHFSSRKAKNEIDIIISVKKRWWNWILIACSALIVILIFLYALKGDK